MGPKKHHGPKKYFKIVSGKVNTWTTLFCKVPGTLLESLFYSYRTLKPATAGPEPNTHDHPMLSAMLGLLFLPGVELTRKMKSFNHRAL